MTSKLPQLCVIQRGALQYDPGNRDLLVIGNEESSRFGSPKRSRAKYMIAGWLSTLGLISCFFYMDITQQQVDCWRNHLYWSETRSNIKIPTLNYEEPLKKGASKHMSIGTQSNHQVLTHCSMQYHPFKEAEYWAPTKSIATAAYSHAMGRPQTAKISALSLRPTPNTHRVTTASCKQIPAFETTFWRVYVI